MNGMDVLITVAMTILLVVVLQQHGQIKALLRGKKADKGALKYWQNRAGDWNARYVDMVIRSDRVSTTLTNERDARHTELVCGYLAQPDPNFLRDHYQSVLDREVEIT